MHNPEKNRAVCIVAKGAYWALQILGWALIGSAISITVGTLVVQVYLNWNWTGIGKTTLVVVVLVLVIGLSSWGIAGLYQWAKRYREDC